MATVNLGSIKFKWKGTYNGATAYTIDDVVEYNGSSYICKLASTGNLPTNTTYFDVMSSAGTNGTDLGTTLTTQGDIVYRDGSGLARLGAGTSGQVLQTNGTGANPSWGTVSSDYVKLATVTASASATLSIDGYFTSDYDVYEIYGYDLFASANSTLRGRVNVSGTADTGSNYDHRYLVPYVNSSGGGFDQIGSFNDNQFQMHYNSFGTTVANGSNVYIRIVNPLTSSSYKMIYYQGKSANGSGDEVGTTYGGVRYKQTSAISGITLFGNNGNLSGTFKIYGIKA